MLRRTIMLFFVCTSIFVAKLYAQGGFTAQTPTQAVYVGVWNEVRLTSEHPIPFKVSVVNAEQKLDSNGRWLKPGKPGLVTITVELKTIHGLGTYYFYFLAKKLPYPVSFLKKADGEKLDFNNRMKKSELLQADSLLADIPAPGANATATFQNFTAQFIDQKGSRTKLAFTGNYLSKDFKDKLNELQSGDIIIFKEMDVSITGETVPRRLQNIVVELE